MNSFYFFKATNSIIMLLVKHPTEDWCVRFYEFSSLVVNATYVVLQNGHVGFMLSCYDANLSYDPGTDTFQVR